jgi:hypothetical protein
MERCVFYLPLIHAEQDSSTELGVQRAKEELAASPRVRNSIPFHSTPYILFILDVNVIYVMSCHY